MKKNTLIKFSIICFSIFASGAIQNVDYPKSKSWMISKESKIGPLVEASDFKTSENQGNRNSYGIFDDRYNSLPTLIDIQNLTEEEVHRTPEIIMFGGEIVGKIHEEGEVIPSKRLDALSFFKRCAEDNQIATPIRAVCLNKIYRLVPAWKIPVSLTDEKFSKTVYELASKLF